MPYKRDDSQQFDEAVWLELFAPLFAEDGNLADRAARLFDYLSLEIENGPMGIVPRSLPRLAHPFEVVQAHHRGLRQDLSRGRREGHRRHADGSYEANESRA